MAKQLEPHRALQKRGFGRTEAGHSKSTACRARTERSNLWQWIRWRFGVREEAARIACFRETNQALASGGWNGIPDGRILAYRTLVSALGWVQSERTSRLRNHTFSEGGYV